MRNLLGALAALSLFSGTPFAQAQTSNSQWYLGTQVAKSNVSSKVVKESGDAALGIAVGYQLDPNFAIEGYARSLSFRLFDGLIGDTNYYPDSHIGVALVASTPFAERFSAFARLGVGRTTSKSAGLNKGDKHETDPHLGLGLEYAITPAWSVNLEASRFTQSKVNTYAFGAKLRF